MEIKDQPVPLQRDDTGTLRLGGSRVSLDTVVTLFQRGATAEEIVQQFPSFDLADVYAVISYCLRHREEAKAYVDERESQARNVQNQIESTYDASSIRSRLVARRDQSGK